MHERTTKGLPLDNFKLRHYRKSHYLIIQIGNCG
jgi:hypothetical protein